MSITNITPREIALQKQVIELAESLRNLGWEFELYKTGARATNQKLLDEISELKAKLAEVEADEDFECPNCGEVNPSTSCGSPNCGLLLGGKP